MTSLILWGVFSQREKIMMSSCAFDVRTYVAECVINVTWILVWQEVHTLCIGTETCAHLEPALAPIYPNPLPYFLPDQYPLR